MSTENTEREERFFTTEDIARQTATELSRAWQCVDARSQQGLDKAMGGKKRAQKTRNGRIVVQRKRKRERKEGERRLEFEKTFSSFLSFLPL